MLKKLKKLLTYFFFLCIFLLLFAHFVIQRKTKNYLYNEVDSIPYNRVAMVLGTSKKLKNGRDNLYFKNRIDAAEALYKSGKISRILVSGDNGSQYYNEPKDMRDELVKRGVLIEHIYMDFAGFRTFDSVYRLRDVFGLKSATIISQKFHNERAVYIGNALGIKMVGYNAENVGKYFGLKTMVREKFARVKVLLDLTLGKKPKFLGDPIVIE